MAMCAPIVQCCLAWAHFISFVISSFDIENKINFKIPFKFPDTIIPGEVSQEKGDKFFHVFRPLNVVCL